MVGSGVREAREGFGSSLEKRNQGGLPGPKAFFSLFFFVCDGFFHNRISNNYLPRLASNRDPPDLCLLSS
jgi:hypothetical protein